ncbi:hypothetical protein [Morganella morganii]|uniref:hypothetical protein n=1 Tax=Morganella morganii TaxID=582 RepID=UPI000FD9E09E|nr:hypothetical protein [Morganella morganii]
MVTIQWPQPLSLVASSENCKLWLIHQSILSEALYKKYGAPSSSSTEEEMQNAIITGNPIYVRFDKDTVILKVERVNKIDLVSLNYVSPDFELSVKEKTQKSQMISNH